MNMVFIDLEKSLSRRRLRHSKAVASTAMLLNHTHQIGLDDESVALAGLYHDLAREWSDEDLLRYTEDNHLTVSFDERSHPPLLHGPVAAHMMRERGASEQVCLAIRHHTLGSVSMGNLGLLIYLADYLEPNRTHLSDEERALLLALKPIETLALTIIEAEQIWRKKPILDVTEELYRHLQKGLML